MSTHPRQLPQASQHRGVGFITPSHPNPSGAGVDTASHILPSFGARASSRAAGGNIISPACPRDPREAAFGHQPPHLPPLCLPFTIQNPNSDLVIFNPPLSALAAPARALQTHPSAERGWDGPVSSGERTSKECRSGFHPN